MLQQFLATNRGALVERCREKAGTRVAPADAGAFLYGVPLFIDQVVDALERERDGPPVRDEDLRQSAPSPSEIGMAAALHGAELLHHGYSIDQVVHHYGDVCQSVSDVAIEQSVSITVEEFRTLNRCLDCAIADAVLSFGDGRASRTSHDALVAESRQRRLVDMAVKAYSALKTGKLGLNGATGAVLGNVLGELSESIEENRRRT